MEDTAMKKRTYEKPTCKVVQLKHRTMLLAGSPTPPNDVPDYGDWLE